MKCPFCGNSDSKVTDSRNAYEVSAIRRRRECVSCQKRFTTFETVDVSLQVCKRDGRFEDFNIQKLISGLDSASRHTRISHDQVQKVSSDIAQELVDEQLRSITAVELGERVMRKLRTLDAVAYVRFACVYRRFKDVDEIMDVIHMAPRSEEIKKG